MKWLNVLISVVCVVLADSRTYNHGACFVEFQRGDSTLYYLTWSSAYDNGWEHDIYHKVIGFDTLSSEFVVLDEKRFIGTGSDEAQEPVHCDIHKDKNYILSVWEDGWGSDAPNVNGQLHTPDGTVIKQEWTIAGGDGSQHSANTSHIGSSFVVLYADEAPPATAGAVVKGKVINDSTGEEKQEIVFSPNDEDHWWPVSENNSTDTRSLVFWGNDGYSVMGTVLYDSAGTVSMTDAPKDFLVNTQQYFYQAEWLEEYQAFLLIARHGAYENLTDSSRFALIDTMGNILDSGKIAGGILRETKMAATWLECDSSYLIFFPSGESDLTGVKIKRDEFFSFEAFPVESTTSFSWEATGIWGGFVKDVYGNLLMQNKYQPLFIMNDTASNAIVSKKYSFDEHLFCGHESLVDYTSYSGSLKLVITVDNGILIFPEELLGGRFELYTIMGKQLHSGSIVERELQISHFAQQAVFVMVYSVDGYAYLERLLLL